VGTQGDQIVLVVVVCSGHCSLNRSQILIKIIEEEFGESFKKKKEVTFVATCNKLLLTVGNRM